MARSPRVHPVHSRPNQPLAVRSAIYFEDAGADAGTSVTAV
jgi:hypothetical protein